MGKPRLFYTGSTRIIGDASITAAEHRVYACVSLHDGMSLLKGKGAGCYASNQKLSALAACDYSTLCKALSRLVERGYLTKTKSDDDRRMTVYRVTFSAQDGWRDDHLAAEEISGEHASANAGIGGEHLSENGDKAPETASHYIPSKGELDSVETGEIDSDESARFQNAWLGKTKFHDNGGAQMAWFERESSARPAAFSDEQLVQWGDWLAQVAEYEPEYLGDPLTGRAQRLLDKLDVAFWERKIGPYAQGEAA